MKTSYLDREIELLKQGFRNKTNSFYQNRKLAEYIEIKKQLNLTDVVVPKGTSTYNLISEIRNCPDCKGLDDLCVGHSF